MDDTTDLRALAEAVDHVRAGEARVRELVALARASGRSWGEIGIALGVSRGWGCAPPPPAGGARTLSRRL